MRNCKSPIDRFISKIIISPNNCWEWQGSKTKEGYGRFALDKIMIMAHRFSYEYHVRYIPENLEIDHICKNKSCVNPSHLEAVTHKVNVSRR